MEPQSAAEHLQVIRTLMERSALYRRALAPVMLTIGALGMLAGGAGKLLQIQGFPGFGQLWMGTGVLGLVLALLLMRRQALGAREAFWSPPTRRISQAIAPAFAAGTVIGLLSLSDSAQSLRSIVPALWMVLYGCALYSAGFFMVRGIRWLGWIFLAAGCLYIVCPCTRAGDASWGDANLAMGAVFGGVHFVYGLYLHFTERKNAS